MNQIWHSSFHFIASCIKTNLVWNCMYWIQIQLRYFVILGVFCRRNFWTVERSIWNPLEALTEPLLTIECIRFRPYCWHSDITALKKTVGNVRFRVLWAMGGRLVFPSSTRLCQSWTSRKFWLYPSKAEGSCIPYFPRGPKKIYSLRVFFPPNLVFQMVEPMGRKTILTARTSHV